MTELEIINDKIARAERRLARTGDEWLKRVAREDLTRLYKERAKLIESSVGS